MQNAGAHSAPPLSRKRIRPPHWTAGSESSLRVLLPRLRTTGLSVLLLVEPGGAGTPSYTCASSMHRSRKPRKVSKSFLT